MQYNADWLCHDFKFSATADKEKMKIQLQLGIFICCNGDFLRQFSVWIPLGQKIVPVLLTFEFCNLVPKLKQKLNLQLNFYFKLNWKWGKKIWKKFYLLENS